METMMIGVQFSRRIVRHGYSRAGLKKDFLEHARDKEHQGRSEEHTSELQSRLHLVCRLLLEKKKKKRCDLPRLVGEVLLSAIACLYADLTAPFRLPRLFVPSPILYVDIASHSHSSSYSE